MRQHGKLLVEEFLALTGPRPDTERWQLIDGVAMMMPPPTLVHQRIASNLGFGLNTHFRAHAPDLCACFRVGLTVPSAELFRPQADIAVLEGVADYEYYADRFYFVAEVLSDSNTDKDIAVKRQRYLQHPDNLYFVLIEQRRVRAEVLARSASWQPLVLEGLDAMLEIPEWSFRTPLAELYRGTPLERAANP